MRPCSSPAAWKSAPYRARPVTLSMPSCRIGRVPITWYTVVMVGPSFSIGIWRRGGDDDHGNQGRRRKGVADAGGGGGREASTQTWCGGEKGANRGYAE